jgi:signal transduction histidine kinase
VLLRSLGARIERLYTHPLSRVLERVRGMDIDQWAASRDDIAKILEAGSAALLGLLEDVEQYLNCTTIREWDSQEECDLTVMVAEVVDGLLKSMPYTGVVVLVKVSGLPQAFGYKRMIRSALEEVIENAIESAADGGKRVEVTGREAGDYVRIEVRDSGRGLSRETVDFMYLPFFTINEGRSGLGLSIVYRVMKRLGGRVGTVEVPEGALFFLEFPTTPRLEETEEPGEPQEAGAGEAVGGEAEVER